jgi:hypothetical protein
MASSLHWYHAKRREDEPLPPGDYQLRVTVIEGVSLAARDASGTSDPFVVVGVAGARQRTHVVHKAISCTWGSTMTFDVPGLTSARAAMLSVSLEARDSDALGSELIGRSSIDLQYLWNQEAHALWHFWLALFSAGSELKPGRRVTGLTSGMLRVSIVLLGPGRTAAIPLEPAREDIARDPSVNPASKLQFAILCLDVLSAEGLRALVPSRNALRVILVLRHAGIEFRSQSARVDVYPPPSAAWWCVPPRRLRRPARQSPPPPSPIHSLCPSVPPLLPLVHRRPRRVPARSPAACSLACRATVSPLPP